MKRRFIVFGFLLLFVGAPLPLKAQPIFLPLILNNIAPVTTGLRNGDFEMGPDGSWLASSTRRRSLILDSSKLPVAPQGGSWAAWLGGLNSETSTLSQIVLLPAAAATLSYYYQIRSYEFPDTCSYDMAYVKMGGILLKSYELCSSSSSPIWTLEQIPIPPAYQGQAVELSFQVINDFDLTSDFFLDTVSISTSAGQ